MRLSTLRLILPSLMFVSSVFGQSDTKAVRSTNGLSSVSEIIVTDPGRSNYVVRSGVTISNLVSLVGSNTTGVGVSPLWYVRDRSRLVAGGGRTLTSTNEGWWMVDGSGRLIPRTTVFGFDYNWTTNLINQLVPR